MAENEGKKKEQSEKGLVVVDEVSEQRDLAERCAETVPQIFNEAQRRLVLNETPRYKIKKRKGKGGLIFDYVDIGYILEQLNILTGHRWDFVVEWQMPLSECKEVNQVIVRGRLTLYGKDGSVINKVNYGKSDIKMKQSGGFLDFGNEFKIACSDCIKKCSSMFGLALDVMSGAVTRSQDQEHPDSKITENQRKRLEVIAAEAGIGHSGLKRIINKVADYKSTNDIQRRHFSDIVAEIESVGSEKVEVDEEVEIPDEILKGFEILGTPKAKQKAVFLSYKNRKGGIEELKKRINNKVDTLANEKEKKTGKTDEANRP